MRMTLASVLISTLAAQTAERGTMVAANQQAQQAQSAGEYALAEVRLHYALRVWAQLRPGERNPADEAVLHGNLAALYVEQQEYAQALAECERALAFRRTGEWLNGAGIALQGLGRWGEAEAAFGESLQGVVAGGYEEARTRFNRATVWAQRGRTADALSEMEAVLPRLESDPLSHATALWQAATLVPNDRARVWLERAQGTLDQNRVGGLFLRRMVMEARAEAERKAGEKKKARQLREEAARLRTPRKAGVSVEALRRERY
jgi:tetratricopeptide (TPR) repeat protein